MSAPDILRPPDRVEAVIEGGKTELTSSRPGVWSGSGIEVMAAMADGTATFTVSATVPLRSLHLRWNTPITLSARCLGDHWERAYGDLEWRPLDRDRIMPWYVLLHDGQTTHGFGVKTGAAALCAWQVDANGIALSLDVGSGTCGVELGKRTLEVATVVVRHGVEGESPFLAARAFCKLLCDAPRLPEKPVYGGNNWYYTYGRSSHDAIVDDARRIADLAPEGGNRPFMVIDGGWSLNSWSYGGPWDRGCNTYPDMPGLADRIKEFDVRPGIWIRPLLTAERLPSEWLSSPDRFLRNGVSRYKGQFLDPSVPDVLARVADDIRRLRAWGYELIKHDFTFYDTFGMWGFEMLERGLGDTAWSFADRSKTTVEVVRSLYQTIRDAAGDALIIGCNTIGHLAAGLFELQRTGDDTSGLEWERTRKMGVNSLAFRMPQHGAFFAADADCVGITEDVPWKQNRQWLDVVARSGTPLFVSLAPDAAGTGQQQAVRRAFELAASPQTPAEPVDWMETKTPATWRTAGGETTYGWADVTAGEGAPTA